MAEIRRLDGSEVGPGGVLVNADVVAAIDEFRALAVDGRLTAFALVAKVDNGMWTRVRGIWAGGYFETIGALESLKYDMIVATRADAD